MIKIAPVNKNNFVRWYPNVSATIDNSTYVEGIHNGYHYRWRTFADYLPVLVGDTLTIYTNFDSPTYLTSKSIKVVEESSCGAYTVIDDATKYDISAVTWGDNNAKITLNIPVTNTYNLKKFRLGIVGDSISENYIQSTKIAESIVGTVRKTITLSSGKLLAIGNFTVVGQTYNNAVVFNTDGTIDTTYDFGIGFDGEVRDAVEQPDGKIVFVGFFINYKGSVVNQMARVNTDGSLDATLVSGIGAGSLVYLVEIDSLGNLYIGSPSGFLYGASVTYEKLYKVDSVGSMDATYTPSITTTLKAIKVQSDDKVLIGLAGQNGIKRLNTDGTADGTFTSALSGIADVSSIDIDASGSIYVAGENLKLTNQLFVKLNTSGSQDAAFITLLGTGATRVYVNGTTVTLVSAGAVKDVDLTGGLINDYVLSGTTITNFSTLGSIKFVTGTSVVYNGGSPTSALSLELEVVADISYVSNYFMVSQRTEKNINNTHLVSFYNNSDVYNYEWGIYDILVDDPYLLRLSGGKVGVDYPTEKEIYKEATTGRPRVTRAINTKQILFEVYYGTEELHDAVSLATNFRNFYINGDAYIVETMEVSYDKIFNLFKSTLTLKDVSFDRRINSCLS